MISYPSILDPDADLIGVSHRILTFVARNVNVDGVIPIVFRIAVVGAFAAALRHFLTHLSAKINRALFPTAYIHKDDSAYLWVMAWIAQDYEALRQIQDFQLTTGEWRNVRKRSGNTLRSAVGEHNVTWKDEHIIGQVLPTYHQSIRIKYEGQYLWITRRMASFARTSYRNVDHLQIQTMTFQRNAIKDFLVAAHQSYFAKENNELLIFHAKRINPTWQIPVSRPCRPWSSIILPGTIKDDLVSNIEKFLSEKETSWYAARGIPHRRGYLFHGDPGAGKSTLATAIASKLHLDIYVVNPAQRGMDDAKLSKLFRDCPAKSIILIEDIPFLVMDDGDNTGTDADTAVDGSEEDRGEQQKSTTPMMGGSHDLAPSTVTLSGLLNAIDGVSSQEGCILIATTNHPDRLDPALGRAGRFDVRIPFYPAIPEQARALFLHFYPLEDFSATASADEKSVVRFSSQADIDSLAVTFTEAIFRGVNGREGVSVSMAALQGYLLGFKEDPMTAADQAEGWAQMLEPKKVGKA
ncbi:MAG: hypothetical protein TREMPRED_000122 [Tremellales sp. Tagirdzhanova-0007]|nr:MAG: hypothetical protein TREMPRED_000122 [Tremellales sp. Tagirdzhanova-0007]